MLRGLRALFEVGHGGHRQIRSMEGLRGLAVFLVFLVHFVTLAEPWLQPGTLVWSAAGHLRAVGHAGVDLFFVLSGYLIYGTLIVKPRPLLPYALRRAQRIYPAFLAVLALYLILSWLFPGESKLPSGVLATGAYLTANLLLLPGLFPIEPIITVAWSLSYEAFYYVAVPLVIGLLRLRRWPRSSRIVFFLVLAFTGLVWAHLGSGSHVRLVMFVAGILLFEALARESRAWPGWLGLLALALALTAFDQVPAGPLRYAVLLLGFFLLCYSAFSGAGMTARVFCWTPLRWLGNMSYSYYLIHGLALKAGFMLLAKLLPTAHPWNGLAFSGMLMLMFGITLIPSTLLFALVERPYSLVASIAAAGGNKGRGGA